MAYSPDGKFLATGGPDRQIRILDSLTRKTLAESLHDADGRDAHIAQIQWSSSGSEFFLRESVTIAYRYDASTLKCRGQLECQVAPICMTTASNSPFYALGGFGMLEVREAVTGELILVLRDQSKMHCVMSLALTPDGKRLAYGTVHGDIGVVEVPLGNEILFVRACGFDLEAVALSPDGSRVSAQSGARTFGVWDCATGTRLDYRPGYAELVALAGGPAVNPWCAVIADAEMAIESTQTGMACAWFPATTYRIVANPARAEWAGIEPNGQDLIRAVLEGYLP